MPLQSLGGPGGCFLGQVLRRGQLLGPGEVRGHARRCSGWFQIHQGQELKVLRAAYFLVDSPLELCACMLNHQSYLTHCNPMDCSLPGPSVHGIIQARLLEWVAIFSTRGSSWPKGWTCVSCISRQILYHSATKEVPPFGLLNLKSVANKLEGI